MSRDITAGFVPNLLQKEITPFFAVDINFSGTYIDPTTGNPVTATPLYLWSGYGNLTNDSKAYLGAGQLLTISTVGETTELEAKGATLSLSGIPSSFLSLAIQTPYQGRECIIYFGLLYPDSYLITQGLDFITTQVGDLLVLEGDSQALVEIFSGELDQMNISEAADTATISVTAESALIKLDRPVVRRFTDSDQRSRFPTDKGLEFVAGLQDKEIFWGRKGTS